MWVVLLETFVNPSFISQKNRIKLKDQPTVSPPVHGGVLQNCRKTLVR